MSEWSDERVLRVSAKGDLQAAMDVESSLAAAAGAPVWTNLGVCVGGLGPLSYAVAKPCLFIAFMDATVLAAPEGDVIPLLFPLVDFHNG